MTPPILSTCLSLIACLAASAFASPERGLTPNSSDIRNAAICNGSGECILALNHLYPPILEACETDSASLSWNLKRDGAYLLTCDCRCTSHDNSGWLIERRDSREDTVAYRMALGKTFTVRATQEIPASINDRVNDPLCGKINTDALDASVFISLYKYPTNRESASYCFAPLYIVDKHGAWQLTHTTSGDGAAAYPMDTESDPVKVRMLSEIVDILEDTQSLRH